jgi:hypothetical protein
MALLLALGAGVTVRAAAPAVSVVRTAAWSAGDAAREGAIEMLVLMELARLRHESARVGLVAVGDRRGLFPAGAETALRDAVLQGVPVVKLAKGGRVLPAPHGLFLDGGTLSEEVVAQVLGRCLELYGTLPAVNGVGADGSVSPELGDRLRLFQNELTLAASTRLAVR